MVHVSPGFGFPVLMCTGPCEESQLRGDGFVPSFDLNFPFGFSSLHAFFGFLSPVGSVERKGSSPPSRCVRVGSEQSCQAPASPSPCSLDAKADACVPLRASTAVPISRQIPPCSALQTVSSWLSHLCHILCSVSPPGDLPKSVSCAGGSTLFSPLEFRVPSRWCCPPRCHPGAILMPS